MNRFLLTFSRPLTPANSHLHLTGSVRLARRRGAAHVLTRALCRFRYIPFRELAKGDRLGYLRVQLLTWSPFPQCDFAVVMGTGGAMVFAWDQAAFVQRCEEAGIPHHSARVIPESLLHPSLPEGVILRRCAEGCEGLVWRAGEVVSSRWWAQLPDTAGWLNFQRGAGVQASEQIIAPPPLAKEVDWSEVPWATPKKLSELLGQDRLYEHAALAFVLLLLALPTLWLLKNWLILDRQVTALTKEKVRVEESARPVLQARSETLDAQLSLDAIAERVEQVNPVVLLAHLSRQLPKNGTILRELEWEGERVRLVLLPPSTSSRIAYVAALEGGGWLHKVRELAPDRPGEVVLAAELVGNAPPSATDKTFGATSGNDRAKRPPRSDEKRGAGL